MSWSSYLVDTLTGNRGPKLSMDQSGSWAENVNKPNEVTVGVSLQDLWDLAPQAWEPWSNCIVNVWSDPETGEEFPMFMGPIKEDPIVNLRDQSASFTVGGPEDLLAYRIVTDKDYGPGMHEALAGSKATLTGSLGNIASEVVRLAQLRRGGGFPVRFATIPEPDVDRTRTYEGFNLSNNDVKKRIEEITAVINGPNVLFVPEWVDGNHDRLRWAMYTGTDGQVTIPQDRMQVFDVGAPGTQISGRDVRTSFNPIRRVYGTGAGEGAGTLVRVVQEDNWRGPMMEICHSDTSIENPELLEEKMRALLAPGRLIQFSIDVDSTYPPLQEWRVGEQHQVIWPGRDGARPELAHPLIPGDTYLTTLIKRSGDWTSRRVKVEFQTVTLRRKVVDSWRATGI